MGRRFLLPALLAAIALPGCGESESRLLSPDQANRLMDRLAAVQSEVDAGECDAARDAAQRGARSANSLGGIDPELKQHLVDWFRHIDQEVRTGCEEEEPEPSPTPDETETPTPDPTETPTPDSTETPTPTATPEPTPTTTPDPGGVEPGDAEDVGD